MEELKFEPDLYEDNGDLVYSHNGLDQNQIRLHYAYMKDFFPKTQGRTAVDVGCRFGEYTHYLLKHFDNVKCFEPRRHTLVGHFNKNIPKDRVQVWNCGIGDKQEFVNMNGGAVHKDNTVEIKPSKYRTGVPVYPLDSFEFDSVDFIKVDVEGYELKVLQGALKTIDKYKPMIVIEQNGGDIKYGWATEENQAGTFLETLGYTNTGQWKQDFVFEYKG